MYEEQIKLKADSLQSRLVKESISQVLVPLNDSEVEK